MVAIKDKTTAKHKKQQEEIPSYLVYETLDGIPVYYRDFKKVLSGELKFEDIMATGDYQAILLTFIRDYLANILGGDFFLIQGETGVHIGTGSNPSLDLCIFPRKDISLKNAKNKYFSKPPLVVIEVDTKADMEEFSKQGKGNYYILKTQRLIDFGVKEVVWIFTVGEKITIARPNQPWLTLDWKDEIEVMGHKLSLKHIIDENEKNAE